jgi:hypothetical protein
MSPTMRRELTPTLKPPRSSVQAETRRQADASDKHLTVTRVSASSGASGASSAQLAPLLRALVTHPWVP